MLKVVIGFALLIRVDIKRPIDPNRRFNNKVYNERIKNALKLKGPFITSSILINPARAVTRFSKNTLVKRTDSLLKKTSLREMGRVSRYSAVLSYSSLSRIFEESTIEKILPSTIIYITLFAA